MNQSAVMRARAAFGRAAEGVVDVVAHERATWSGHWAELRERLAVARKARGLGELLRDQVDLIPETRARLRGDHQERSALLRNGLRGVVESWRTA